MRGERISDQGGKKDNWSKEDFELSRLAQIYETSRVVGHSLTFTRYLAGYRSERAGRMERRALRSDKSSREEGWQSKN